MHRESTHSNNCGREEDAPTVFRHAYFRSVWSLRSSSDLRLFLCSAVRTHPAERNTIMKLKIRFENEYQTVELDANATQQMWVSLSLEGEGLSQEEKERKIQEAFDDEFNRPEYNNWRKENRHRGYSSAKPDDESDEVDTSEPLLSEVRDPRIFMKDEIERNKKMDYEFYCERIRATVKPDQADMLIAIILDGMTVAEYAESIGDTANNVSHRYRRAINKFKKFL